MRFCLIIFSILLATDCYSQNTTSMPLKNGLKQGKTKTAVTKYLDAAKWNELFPNRKNFYSFKNFVTAASLFPDFLAEADSTTQKRELAAFLANMAHETSGGMETSPSGEFKYGLYFIKETNKSLWAGYSDKTNTAYPPVKGKNYYGRGPVQLSWNYNYGQFSEAWYGSKDTLLQHPEYLVTDPVLSFASALWFWMTPQFPKPSCHDVMAGNWKPTPDDIAKNRLPGFGATVNVINGGIECGKNDNENTKNRYGYYEYFCKFLQVSPGDNVKCTTQKPFGQ